MPDYASYTVASQPKADTGADKIGKAIKSFGQDVGSSVADAGKEKQRQLLEEAQEIQKQDIKELKRQQEELKAAQEQQEARDRIVAVDALGKAQREYMRQSQEFDRTYVGSKTAPEYEEAKKELFNNLIQQAGAGLSDKPLKEMQKSAKTWLNAQLLSDLEKTYKEEAQAAEEAAQNVANDSLATGAALGESGDIQGAMIAFGMTRQELKNFADKMAKDSTLPMKEFDANYMLSFLTGAAKSNNPDLAWAMSSPENLAGFMDKDYESDKNYFDKLSVNLRKHLEKPIEYGRNKLKIEAEKQQNAEKVKETLEFINNPIIMGAMLDTGAKESIWGEDAENLSTSYKMYKSGEKKFVAENEKIDFDKIDTLVKAGATEEDAIKSVYDESLKGAVISDDVSAENFKGAKAIDALKNITPAEAERYMKEGTSAVDIIKAQARKLYDNSGKVGDGSISNAELHNIIKQVAGITINETGSVDNNLVKAFIARNYLQDHNASPEQIQVFNNAIAQALTNRDFKDGVAKLANMPTFDSMLKTAWGSSKLQGVAGIFRSQSDDMNDYIENQGRNAYLEAMTYLAAGDPDTAIATYNNRIKEAYDFVISDVIDVNMVNRELERGVCPIVSINGTSVMITGRNGNGEFLIKSTGRKVNGNI